MLHALDERQDVMVGEHARREPVCRTRAGADRKEPGVQCRKDVRFSFDAFPTKTTT